MGPSVYSWWEILLFLWSIIVEYRHSILPVITLGGVLYLIRRQTAALRNVAMTIGAQIEALTVQSALVTEAVDTVQQQVAAVEEEVEQASLSSLPGPQTANGTREFYLSVNSIWSDTKARIQRAIKDIDHAGTRRKYSKFSRKNYEEIIHALRNDKKITVAAEAAMLNMNNRYMALRFRPSRTTSGDVDLFNAWAAAVDKDLPLRRG